MLCSTWLCAACFPQFGEYDNKALDAGGGDGGGGQGGAGGVAPTGAGVAEGGGQGIEEIDCTNGLDDDADGSPDCQDEDCELTTCVTVPEGWQGPVALTHSGGGCGGVYFREVLQLKENISGAPADCPCACGEPTGGLCTIASPFEVHAAPGCGDPTPQQYGVTQACSTYGITGAQSMLIHDSALNGGSCLPLQTPAPARVELDARAICATETGNGCGAGACTPRPNPEEMEPFVCVYQSGDVDCPVGFATKHRLFEDVVDDRACSAGCVCGAPRCPVTFDSHTTGSCGTPAVVTYSSDMGCIDNPEDITFGDFSIHEELASCRVTQDSNEPVGAAVGAAPVTVCCADP